MAEESSGCIKQGIESSFWMLLQRKTPVKLLQNAIVNHSHVTLELFG